MERTTNLSLKKPGLDDDALISDLNDNANILDSKIGPVGNVSLQSQINSQNNNIAKLQQGIAIIVDGDTASVAVPVGWYAHLKNNTHGLADGLYKNISSSAFPVIGGTANSTVFTAVPTGAVNDAVETLNDRITNLSNTVSDKVSFNEILQTDTSSTSDLSTIVRAAWNKAPNNGTAFIMQDSVGPVHHCLVFRRGQGGVVLDLDAANHVFYCVFMAENAVSLVKKVSLTNP